MSYFNILEHSINSWSYSARVFVLGTENIAFMCVAIRILAPLQSSP